MRNAIARLFMYLAPTCYGNYTRARKSFCNKKKKINFFLFFYRVRSRQFLGEADFIALDEIFSCMLVCHTVRREQRRGAIGIGNRQLDGDGRAGLETHVERGEQNGTRRNKKSGAEDTRAIHNARTSVEMRPTDKFDGKWKNKKKGDGKARLYEGGTVYVMLARPSCPGSLFPGYKINTEIPNIVTT